MTTFIGMPVTVVDDSEKLFATSSIILAAMWRPDWLVCTSHVSRLDSYPTTHNHHTLHIHTFIPTLTYAAKW